MGALRGPGGDRRLYAGGPGVQGTGGRGKQDRYIPPNPWYTLPYPPLPPPGGHPTTIPWNINTHTPGAGRRRGGEPGVTGVKG